MPKIVYNSCKICGIPQGRKLNSMCWEKYNVCSKCWKANYRPKIQRKEKQSCKVCGLVRTNYNKAKCWEEDLCGNCVNPVNKVIRIKKKKVCQCGEVMVRLNYITLKGEFMWEQILEYVLNAHIYPEIVIQSMVLQHLDNISDSND